MGKILSLIVAFLHHSVRIIEGLPHSTTTGVFLSFPEMLLIFILILTGYLMLVHKNRTAFVSSLTIVVMLVTSFSARSITNAGQQHFVVYSANRATAIDFYAGNKVLMLASSDFSKDPRQQEFTLSGMRLRYGHKKATHTVVLDTNARDFLQENWGKKGGMMMFGDLKLLIIDQNSNLDLYLSEKHRIDTDYLLLVQNPRIDIQALLQAVSPKMVIVDSSNSSWMVARWEEAFIAAGVSVWNVRKKGAFVSKWHGG